MPTSSQYGANSTLSGFAVRYNNKDYIADRISPVYEVDATSQYYYEFGQTEGFDDYEQDATDESSISESKGDRTQKSFTVSNYSHRENVSAMVLSEGELLGLPEIDIAVARVTDVVLRKRERRAAARLFSSANYAAGFFAAVVNKWGTATVKQITTDINTARDVMVGKGNDKLQLTLGRQAWRSLSTNANILANVTPTKAVAQLTPEVVAELLQVDEIVYGEAKYTTKLKDKTTKADIWGDNAVLNIITPKPSMMATGHNVTFRRKLNGKAVRAYVIPHNEGPDGGTWIKVTMTEKTAHIVNDQAGYLFTAVSV